MELPADSRERAGEIARRLASVNAERRTVEREVEGLARAELKALGDPGPAVVVAGTAGIGAWSGSSLETGQGHRPASVVISIDGETGRGSARSVPGLDLHAAIGAADLLGDFGGHAAAAGLSAEDRPN